MAAANSVVIINHDTKDALSRLLANLAIGESVTSEVIVVDSGSFDESAELVHEDFPTVRLIQLEDNRGFSVAANRGFTEATGEVVVFCHADIVAEIHQLVDLADRVREGQGARVAAALPRFVREDRAELPLVGSLPGLGGAMVSMINPSASRGCEIPTLDHVADNEWAQMPCVAISSDVFQKLGGFDERFFQYYADADLCQRLHEKSLRIAIRRDIAVIHAGGDPSRALSQSAARIMRKDLLRFIEKHQPGLRSSALGLQAKVLGMMNKDAI
jgi:GT2 family glycosyltransferase